MVWRQEQMRMADNAIWAFAKVLRTHWFTAMSGGFSVPFAAAAVFSDQAYQQLIWGTLALGAFGFATFRLWKIERDTVVDLQKRLEKFENKPELTRLRGLAGFRDARLL
jgi:hypothetical protein